MEADVGKEYTAKQKIVVLNLQTLHQDRLALKADIESDEFNALSTNEKNLLNKQQQLMYELERVMQARISNF